MKTIVFLFLTAGFLFSTGYAKEEKKTPAEPPAPVTLKDTGINKIKDYAGDWIAYWMQYNRITSKLNTKFILTRNGEWYVSIKDAPPEKKGTWRLVDEFLLLKPNGAAEKHEMLAKLVDKDHFLMQSESQPNLAVVYRRASAVKPVEQAQIQGTWRFTEQRPVSREKRQSPFLLNFDGAGHYTVTLLVSSFPIPKGAEKGTYTIEGDFITLKNDCKTPGIWSDMKFLFSFGNLILDSKNSYIYGEKE